MYSRVIIPRCVPEPFILYLDKHNIWKIWNQTCLHCRKRRTKVMTSLNFSSSNQHIVVHNVVHRTWVFHNLIQLHRGCRKRWASQQKPHLKLCKDIIVRGVACASQTKSLGVNDNSWRSPTKERQSVWEQQSGVSSRDWQPPVKSALRGRRRRRRRKCVALPLALAVNAQTPAHSCVCQWQIGLSQHKERYVCCTWARGCLQAPVACSFLCCHGSHPDAGNRYTLVSSSLESPSVLPGLSSVRICMVSSVAPSETPSQAAWMSATVQYSTPRSSVDSIHCTLPLQWPPLPVRVLHRSLQ